MKKRALSAALICASLFFGVQTGLFAGETAVKKEKPSEETRGTTIVVSPKTTHPKTIKI